MTNLPTACVIGAGSSGIAAAKALHERGHPVRLLREVRPGRRQLGVRATRTACRRRTARCTSTPRASGWSTPTIPMPPTYPDFPHHTQIAALLRQLRRPLRVPRQDRVRDRRGARRAWGGRRLDGDARHRRDASLRHAAGGQWPPLESALARAGRSRARSTGEQMHSHHYIENSDFRDKNVLVVGIGNSAMDIAVESSFVARKTFLSSGAAPTSCPSTCSGGRSTRSGSTRSRRCCRSPSGARS